jgi:hypothetical protein
MMNAISSLQPKSQGMPIYDEGRQLIYQSDSKI